MKAILRLAGLLPALALITAAHLRAQSFSPLTYEWYPEAAITADPEGAEQGARFRAVRFTAGVAYPLSFRGGRTTLVQALRYDQLDPGYTGPASPQPTPGRLHYARYEFVVIQRFAHRLGATAFVSPGIASDFELPVAGPDLHFRVGAIMQRYAGSFTLGLGATYGDRVKTPFLPVVQVVGPLGRHFRANLLIPSYARLWYEILPESALEAGLHLRFASTPFSIRTGEQSRSRARVEHRLATFGPCFSVHLTGIVYLTMDVGATLWHKLEFRDSDYTLTFDRAGFFRAAIDLRPRPAS